MDNVRVSSLIGAEINDAIGNLGSEVTQERKDALEYYLSEPFGNEQDGRSSVISSDVHDVVEWILPSLMRTFCSSDQIVRFDARQESDIEAARQATDYVNFIITQDNEWTQVAYSWMKDALIQKVGVIKHLYETVEEYDMEMYEDLTDAEYALIASDPDFEILEHTEKSVELQVDVEEDDDALVEGMMTGTSHDVRGRRSSETGRVTIVNVPPEEFLISKDARTVDDATFVAHRVEKSVYELVQMGFDREQVENLPSYSSLTTSEERRARYNRDDDVDNDVQSDPMLRKVLIHECYMRFDPEDDGRVALHKVTVGGSGYEILDVEEVMSVPFSTICPIQIPHKFYGLSVADTVMDLQLIKSTIMRQTLDGLYMTTNPRLEVVEGQTNIGDLLNNRPGSIVRVRQPGAIRELNQQGVNAAKTIGMLDYLDGVRESRTGVSKNSMGLNAEALQNTTATAVSAMQNVAQQKVELIARMFAETGIKHMAKCVLMLVSRYQSDKRIMRIRDKYIEFDPRMWSNKFDASIDIGYGGGMKEGQMRTLAVIAEKQEQLLQMLGPNNPLVDMKQYRDTLAKIVESAGFNRPEAFFKPITADQIMQMQQAAEQPQEPQMTPEMMQVQAEIEADRMKMEAEIQLKREKQEAELQLKIQELNAEIEMKRIELATETGDQQINIRSVG